MSHLNLEQQRKRAKDLHRAFKQGDPEAGVRFARYLPLQSKFTLSEAQFVVAREAGFASWPKLKQALAGTSSPFTGTWTLNVLKSKQHPVNSFNTATLEFEVSGNDVTIAHLGGDTALIHLDGKEYPSGSTGHVGMATWLSSHAFEVLDKQGEKVVGRGIYEVSADGRSLSIDSGDQSLVFDRS